MSVRLDDATARDLVRNGADIQVADIGRALDPKGDDFVDGLSSARLAALLQIGQTAPWSQPAGKGKGGVGLFSPMCTVPKEDGQVYRSLLPEDLAPEEEGPIRAQVEQSGHSLVRAHLSEVLWVRFRRFPDAATAISARFDAARQADAERYWPGIVKNLGRLTTLLLRLNQRERLPALIISLDYARVKLTQCSLPFSFLELANMVRCTLLARPEGRESFSPARAAQWQLDLRLTVDRYLDDPRHEIDAMDALREWMLVWGRDGVPVVEAQVVNTLRKYAKAGSPSVAPLHLQRALHLALEYKLSQADQQKTKLELVESIKSAVPHFRKHTMDIPLPPDLVASINEIANGPINVSEAVRQLACFPGLLDVDKSLVRSMAVQTLAEAPFTARLTSVRYGGGKVVNQASTYQENVEQQLGRLIEAQFAIVIGLLHNWLKEVNGRIEDRSLLDSLGQWPILNPNRRTFLAYASHRFAQQDWTGSGFVVATQFEGLLRDQLRALGYSAIKDADGVQMDETLNSLLRTEAALQLLGSEFRAAAEFILCDPAFGWNLRNEIAHGTVRPSMFSAERVLIVWLLVVRLACRSADLSVSIGANRSEETS